MRAGGGITARGDAVRRPLMSVSFYISIPDSLSSFFFLCARRLLHRGASLEGIASDPLRAGGGITARGDAVRRPLRLVPFSILIPNAHPSFFSPHRTVLLRPHAIPLGKSVGGIASDPLRAGSEIIARGDAVRRPLY